MSRRLIFGACALVGVFMHAAWAEKNKTGAATPSADESLVAAASPAAADGRPPEGDAGEDPFADSSDSAGGSKRSPAAAELAHRAIVVASPEEIAAREKLEHALDEHTKLDFTEVPLAEVVAFFHDLHRVEFQLDQNTLDDASIGSETPITRRLEGISLRAALRLTFEPLDMTYVIRDEVILITTRAKAAGTLVTKIYPVDDLAAPQSRGKTAEDFQWVTEVVRASFPSTRSAEQSAGSVMILPEVKSLIVTHNDETHERVAGLLEGLRKARQVQFSD